jgi:hypothetical protein
MRIWSETVTLALVFRCTSTSIIPIEITAKFQNMKKLYISVGGWGGVLSPCCKL